MYMIANRLFRKNKNKTIELLQDYFLTFLFYIFRIFPIQKNKIVVSCFKNRGFCDSPKYIILKLLETDTSLNIVWLCDYENPIDMPACIKQIPYHSFRGIYEQVTAAIWISNRRKSRYVRKRKHQYYIQTWHGGIRLKNTERAAENVLTKRYIASAKNDAEMTDLFLSNSNFSSQIIRRDMWYRGSILQKGLPRTDILLNGDVRAITEKVKIRLGISNNHRILLYAPTFRSDFKTDKYNLPMQKVVDTLTRATNMNWDIVIHLHTNINSHMYLPEKINNVIDASAYEDVQELLIASDMLISDYSSIIFDFALLNKPIIQYCPDIKEYLNDRGFNQNFDELPFYVSYSQKDVTETIITAFTSKRNDTYKWMINKYGLTESGRASKYVSQIILQKLERRDSI